MCCNGSSNANEVKNILFFKTFRIDEEWCLLFWNNLPRFQDSEVLAQKLMTSQAAHMTAINQKIKNIVKNIGWVLFKLGSDDLHQVMHKVIPSMLLPWQPFCCWVYLMQD